MKQREIFIQALEQPDPDARSAFLDSACANDPDLRNELEALLADHQRDQSFFLDSPPAGVGTAVFDTRDFEDGSDHDQSGNQIGPYKLLEVIGEGGMGTVYMAKQTEPVNRKVALKLIKAGMDTRQVVARFEAERQLLAMMDHPNIAKVLDAGSTESGSPYFVMELVKGKPITKFCDEQQLDTQARLKLFQQVCNAVQHAHQKGIIHRDIKPSNVLVAMYDDKPVPKVIDFGVAKATGEEMTEKTMFTRFGQIIGTLEYMSPEQAQFNNLDIDTRSDIYSLGAILFELLVGEPPFDRDRIKSQALDETLRMIREDEPTKPSTKLGTAAKTAQVAANRKTSLEKLGSIVRGELDWIVMKALEKNRARRYETANGLAADIKRYLNDEPILACPPTAAYRFRKFAERNKVGLAFTSVICVLLFAGIVGLTAANFLLAEREKAAQSHALRADREAASAKAISDFLINDLIKNASPKIQPNRELTILEAMDRASPLIAQRFENQPEVAANLHFALADAYESLDQFQKAIDHYLKAKLHFETLYGPDHSKSVEAEVNILRDAINESHDLIDLTSREDAAALFEKCKYLFGETDDRTQSAGEVLAFVCIHLGTDKRDSEPLKYAQELLSTLLDMTRTKYKESDPPILSLKEKQVSALMAQRRIADAEKLARSSLEERVYGDNHPLYFLLRRHLAVCLITQGRNKESIEILQALVTDYEAVGLGQRRIADAKSLLSNALASIGQFDEAEKLAEEALSAFTQSLGRSHTRTIEAINVLAIVLFRKGEIAESEKYWKEAFDLRTKSLGPEHQQTLSVQQNLAVAFQSQGRLNEALKTAQEVLEIRSKTMGPSARDTLACRGLIATIYDKQGRYQEAAQAKSEILDVTEKEFGKSNPDTLMAMHNYGVSCCYVGRFQEAVETFRECLRLRRSQLGDKAPDTLWTQTNLAEIIFYTGDFEASEKLAENALEIGENVLGPRHPVTLESKRVLALAWSTRNKLKESEELLVEVVAAWTEQLGESHADTLEAKHDLAVVLNSRGHLAQAEDLLVEVIDARSKTLGTKHSKTLISRHELGNVWINENRFDEAIEVWSDVLEVRQNALGPTHPYTLESQIAVVFGTLTRGWNPECEDLVNSLFERKKEIATSNYYRNREGLNRVRSLLVRLGKHVEAKRLKPEQTDDQQQSN